MADMEPKRICNFSKLETDTLITLVKKYKDIVECKKSDTVKWKEKLKAWDEISKEFNLILGQNIQRSSKNLRNKYENIKKTSKKKFAMEKREFYKTGGGTPAPVIITKTDFDVKELLGVAVTGLTNCFDDDSCNHPQQVIEEIIVDHDYIQDDDNLNENTLGNGTFYEETSAELHWSSWNPSDLRSRTSPPLRVEAAVEDPHTSGCAGNTKGKNESLAAKAAKKRSRSDITQECRFKISAMSQAKIELARVQMDAIKQEMDLKQKEYYK